jgi:hypothetical protein
MSKHYTKLCSVCGQILENNYDLKCTFCSGTSRETKLEFIDSVEIDETGEITHDQLISETINEQVEKREVLTYIILLITFGSPVIGFFVADYIGVLAGLVFGAITYHFGPKAFVKVRQITKIFNRNSQRF